MAIFRGFAIYLALAGLILGIILIKKLGQPDPVVQPIAEPTENPYDKTIAASGLVEAADRNILIGSPQSGLIAHVYVNVWDQVSKGQPLFQLDERELHATYMTQKANIIIAEAQLNRIKAKLKRLESVADERAISQDEREMQYHDVKIAEAQLEAANAQCQQTLLLLDRLTVCAPKDGVVLQNNIRNGEFVSSVQSTPILVLGDLNRLQVRVDIDEQNAYHIKPQLAATAFLKNNTRLAIPLKFERIEPYVIPKKSLTGASDERVDTRVLQVLYSFDRPLDFPVYVGQQVDVFIERSDLNQKEELSQVKDL